MATVIPNLALQHFENFSLSKVPCMSLYVKQLVLSLVLYRLLFLIFLHLAFLYEMEYETSNKQCMKINLNSFLSTRFTESKTYHI